MNLSTLSNNQFVCFQEGGTRYLFPSEKEFPGIEEKIKELCDLSWTFNKTPKFSVVRDFVFPGTLRGVKTNADDTRLKIELLIDKGRISKVEFSTSGLKFAQELSVLKEVQSDLTERDLNSQLITDCVVKVEEKAALLSYEDKIVLSWIMNCVKKLFDFC